MMLNNNSKAVNNYLSPDNPLFWSRPTPLSCNAVRLIGICLCLAAFIGIILNGALVYSFARYKFLRTPPNIFIMFISIIGLVTSCSIIPLAGSSSIYCYWLFNRGGCQFEGIMTSLYGCSSSYLLCAVSLSRCYIIVRPFHAKAITAPKCIIIASVAVTITFIWVMMPVLGWNEYTLEGALTSCCINWYDRRLLFVSYNFFLFAFFYCLPLIILITANTRIYLGLKKMRNKLAQGDKTELSQKRIEMEGRILKSTIMTVLSFVITWTPYAIVFFIAVFRGPGAAVPPMATFICACFAKSSVMWIPMLYISTSTYFRPSFVDMKCMDKQGSMSSTGAGTYNPYALPRKNEGAPAISVIQASKEKRCSAIDKQ